MQSKLETLRIDMAVRLKPNDLGKKQFKQKNLKEIKPSDFNHDHLCIDCGTTCSFECMLDPKKVVNFEKRMLKRRIMLDEHKTGLLWHDTIHKVVFNFPKIGGKIKKSNNIIGVGVTFYVELSLL